MAKTWIISPFLSYFLPSYPYVSYYYSLAYPKYLYKFIYTLFTWSFKLHSFIYTWDYINIISLGEILILNFQICHIFKFWPWYLSKKSQKKPWQWNVHCCHYNTSLYAVRKYSEDGSTVCIYVFTLVNLLFNSRCLHKQTESTAVNVVSLVCLGFKIIRHLKD